MPFFSFQTPLLAKTLLQSAIHSGIIIHNFQNVMQNIMENN